MLRCRYGAFTLLHDAAGGHGHGTDGSRCRGLSAHCTERGRCHRRPWWRQIRVCARSLTREVPGDEHGGEDGPLRREAHVITDRKKPRAAW